MVSIDNALYLFGIYILAGRAHNHIVGPAFDHKIACFFVEDAEVFGAEPAVLGEGLGSSLGVLEVALHNTGSFNHQLALARLGIYVDEFALDVDCRFTNHLQLSLLGCRAIEQRCGFGQAIANGVGEVCLTHKALGLPLHLGATDTKEAHAATKEFLHSHTGHAVQKFAHQAT